MRGSPGKQGLGRAIKQRGKQIMPAGNGERRTALKTEVATRMYLRAIDRTDSVRTDARSNYSTARYRAPCLKLAQ